jgi:hypothetical protein
MGARRQRADRSRRCHRCIGSFRPWGALEAADLVQSGIATRVAVFADPPSRKDHEFLRQRLSYEDGAARQIRQLRWLGVMDVVQIPRTDVGTEREGISSVLGCREQDQPVRRDVASEVFGEHGGRHCEHVAKEARIGFRHEADVVEAREARGSMDCDVLRSTTGPSDSKCPPN